MGRFVIIVNEYSPNTAVTNHTLSYLKAFSEMGIKAEAIFINSSDASLSELNRNYRNISFSYLCDGFFSRIKYIKFFFVYIKLYLFIQKLNADDSVLLLGAMKYLGLFINKSRFKVYHERTEHPDVIRTGGGAWLDSKYKSWLPKTDGLFVISTGLKNYFVSIGCQPDKVHIVNMIVDSNRFAGLEKKEVEDHYIAYCGNASNSKDGVDNLIRAFRYVVDVLPKEKLYIIGKKNEKENGNSLLAESLGLKNNIIFTGIIPASEMPQMLVNADALALCRPSSLQNEMGFPTKLGEYLLSGNPVIVTKVGDIPIFLEDGESALMTETTDVKGFGLKMLWALQHQKEARTIGLLGKKIAKENFNYLKEAKKILNVINTN